MDYTSAIAPSKATAERHEYDSFPEPKPFWIATCKVCLVALNSGHHYRDERLAQRECDHHNASTHPLAHLGEDLVGWGDRVPGMPADTALSSAQRLQILTYNNSVTIRHTPNTILSLAVAEPRRDGLATCAVALLLEGNPGVKWRITQTLSPEADSFWDAMRDRFPRQSFPLVAIP